MRGRVMNYARAKEILKIRGQEQLLEYFEELTQEQKTALLNDIENTNFSILKNIKKNETRVLGKLAPINAVTVQEIARRRMQFETVGLNLLSEGKIGAVLLAGGQGTFLCSTSS